MAQSEPQDASEGGATVPPSEASPPPDAPTDTPHSRARRPRGAAEMLLRGLAAEDLAAIEALLTERRALLRPLGATLSRNALVLLLLRRGLEVERAQAPRGVAVPPVADGPTATTPTAIEDPDPEPTIRPPPPDATKNVVSPEGRADWQRWTEEDKRYRAAVVAWHGRNRGVAMAPCLACLSSALPRVGVPTPFLSCTCGRERARARRMVVATAAARGEPTPGQITLDPMADDPEPTMRPPPNCPDPEIHDKISEADRVEWEQYRADCLAYHRAHREWEERWRAQPARPRCGACRVRTGPRGGSSVPGPPRMPCTCGRNPNAA